MKKQIYSLVMAVSVLLAMSSCNRENDEDRNVQPVRGEIAVATQQALTNASTAPVSKAGEPLTYTLEVWTRDAEPRCLLHQTAQGDADGAVFEVALIPGTYDFLYWADYGQGYYETSDLRNVKLALSANTYVPDDARDAFACASSAVEWTGGAIGGVTLKRPLAQLTVQNTSAFTTANDVVIAYGGLLTQYDVLTGQTSVPVDVDVICPQTTSGSLLVGKDFLFAPSNGQFIDVAVTVGAVTKQTVTLQLKPNYKTMLTATF